MLERLRHALVKSYVGAIALGWTFAQAIFHFANIFSAPFTMWLTRREYRLMGHNDIRAGFCFQQALPELLKFFLLLVVGYLLLRWLYFKPLREETALPPPEDASAAAG